MRRRRSWNIAVTPGTLSRCQGSMTVVAQSGSKPTMERTLRRVALTIGMAQDVVVKPVLLVPHAIRPHLVHGAGDPQEMVDELRRHIAVVGILGRQLNADLQHVLAEQCDPGRAVGLLQVAAGGQRRAAVEDADIVQPEEASLEEVLAEAVFAIHPPGEVQQQALRKTA